jgi:hypothetical protein
VALSPEGLIDIFVLPVISQQENYEHDPSFCMEHHPLVRLLLVCGSTTIFLVGGLGV